MKLKLVFGEDTVTADWDKDVYSFPKHVTYLGYTWQWTVFDMDVSGYSDYELTFFKMSKFGIKYLKDVPTLHSVLYPKESDAKCDCGGELVGAEHYSWCSKIKKIT